METHRDDVRREIKRLRLVSALSIAVAALSLIGSISSLRGASFDVVNVHRLNVLDENGTVRLALFNKQNEPGPVIAGKLLSPKGRNGGTRAGIFFYNDAGDEQGGLTYHGDTGSGNGATLSFDPLRQNDDVDLFFRQKSGNSGQADEGLSFNQHDRLPLTWYIAQLNALQARPKSAKRDAEIAQLQAQGFGGQQRLFAGVDKVGRSSIVLNDTQGRPRVVIRVESSGTPSIQLLDANGHVTRSVQGS